MKQADIDDQRNRSLPDAQLLVGGQWQAAQSGQTLDVVSPIDGRVLCQMAQAGAVDVDAAVRVARAAFERGPWPRMAPAERKKILHRIADLIEAHHTELAVLGVRDNGTEIAMAWKAEPGSAAG
ncbi:MAG: aldehyde dehydrogenase family protein, partial [Betaproteobacteria bacterium]|nr:aldehyde dehydrogenase family protein [Betaproteobacteria bacterium]